MPVTMTPVSSSNVAEVGYNPDNGDLVVNYRSGGAPYIYEFVPAETHATIMQSSSIGAAIASLVKGKYNFHR